MLERHIRDAPQFDVGALEHSTGRIDDHARDVDGRWLRKGFGRQEQEHSSRKTEHASEPLFASHHT
jgi:hypothetical protein